MAHHALSLGQDISSDAGSAIHHVGRLAGNHAQFAVVRHTRAAARILMHRIDFRAVFQQTFRSTGL